MQLKEIETKNILANFYQPRIKFDSDKTKELAESILGNGLVNPITVRTWKDKRFMIVSGERRWRAHKLAKIKTVPCIVKEYKNDIQFMIESLVENIQREDLSSMETAKFILKIKKAFPGKVSNRELSKIIGMDESNVSEHLSLIEISTPKIVQKAVEEKKLAMRSATMIRKLPEKEQVAIAKESMKRETGMGRTEVTKLIKEKIPEPIQYERTANDVGNDLLSVFHNFEHHVTELLKDNIRDLSKSNANQLMTTSGLHIKHFVKLIYTLKERGAKPNPLILALIKANGKI